MKNLSRRDFVKISSILSASLFVPKFIKTAKAEQFIDKYSSNGNILVVIQLSGGNDGLNTVIPYYNDIYYKSRPGIAIEKSKVLKLNDYLALNPNMNDIKKLYDEGYLKIINNVGYPNPDRSHFRSMDIWQSASDSNEYINTGWIGRYLDSGCAGCEFPHKAVEVDGTLSLAMKGEHQSGLAMQDAKRFIFSAKDGLIEKISNTNKNIKTGNESKDYLYKVLNDTYSSVDSISKYYSKAVSKGTYPDNEFSKNLKSIASLINSGLNTSIYYISLSGFDTHTNQLNTQNNLLKTYSGGVKAFTDDLKSSGKLGNVTILTFSEFGRRVAENGSKGTDHGTANNVFIISGKLSEPGVDKSNPDLQKLDEGDLIYKTDFRSIYATLLEERLNADSKSILGKNFPLINI